MGHITIFVDMKHDIAVPWCVVDLFVLKALNLWYSQIGQECASFLQ